MINIPDIEKTARAATPGEWSWNRYEWRDGYYGLFSGDTPVVYPQRENDGDSGDAWFSTDEDYCGDTALRQEDADHIASANPAAVLEMTQLIRELAGAAQAVVAHWDTPAWKYEQHTGEVIAGLRAAIEKARQAGVTDHIADINKMVATEQSSAVAARNAELLAALVEARDSVADWGIYASEYFQEKHDLAGDLAKIDAVIERGSK